MGNLLTIVAKTAVIGLILTASAAAQPVSSLKVMTFNVWTGEGSAAGRNKITQIIQAADADVVGIQELDAAALAPIAGALGFHFSQQSGGDIQVFSRFPITASSAAGLGVRIEPSPGQSMWLFNAHLAPYPYQPYDLRDGTLPMNEPAVIAAANSARGSQLTSFLNDMTMALSSRVPVFFTGDFNEPSHLDWTPEAALATPRPFDLAVHYPASSRIVSRGMIDSFRAVRPDEVADPAYTWTPGYPPPTLDSNEVHDRIDIIYHSGLGVTATGAWTVGLNANDGMTDIAVPGYNADHRAVVVEYQIPICSVFADLNLDCQINVQDWIQFRSGQLANMNGLTANQAYVMGDLNGDFRNDYRDFQIFRGEFNLLNGDGAFERMLTQIPEPAGGATVLVALGWLMLNLRHPPRSSRS
jgi:endonuclease/exonuclease/phosphatase family metal-dependent hydrolase